MADANTSLPVRTQTNGDVVAQIVDGTITTQKLAVDATGRVTTKMNDGNGNAVTSQVSGAQRALDVGIDVAGVQIDPRSIRALTSTDVVTVQQGTSPWISKDQADGPVVPGAAASFSILSGVIAALTSPTATAGQQLALQADLSGNLKVNLQTPIPAGANLIGATNLFLGGSTVSGTNPVPVSISTSTPGLAVQNYNTAVALAAAASTTFTYTVAVAHTFNLQRIFASASGKIKVVVQTNAATIFAGFNSTANPNVDITVTASPLIAAAGTVNVIITNLDLVSQDVYATIEGNQN